MLDSDWLARDRLENHSVDLRQFIDFRESRLPNGVRIVDAHNSSGLAFTVLPDRGLDIWTATYHGLPLTWISQGSPFAADAGEEWLRLFNGGLLTTCGLQHVGPPETDILTGEKRDLHGRYTRLGAQRVCIGGGWEDDRYVMTLSGVVAQGGLFKEQLRLERSYRLVLGEPGFEIIDQVTNVARDAAAPLMLLYHFNLGYPLVRAGSELVTASQGVYPRDADAAFGQKTWADYDEPSPAYDEQVFFHHMLADDDQQTAVALVNPAFGLEIAWDTSTLPYLTQWKNMRQGIYVSGLEPGNCIPEGQTTARINRRLELLGPGESRLFHCALRLIDGADAVDATRQRLAALAESGTPVAGCLLHDFA